MRKYKLFYSWQADKTDVKQIIRKSIDKSVKDLRDIGIDFSVDQDTRDRIGTASIDDEVLKKIRECDVFLADLTPVTEYERDGEIKLVPNSNVIYEYGYAKGIIGMKRCVLVSKLPNNRNISQLPFDINHDTISIIKDGTGISNLRNWLLKIVNDIDKEKESQASRYHCKLLFDNFDIATQIMPVFRKTIFNGAQDELSNVKVYLMDSWTHKTIPMFTMSKNGAIAAPVSELVNKSLSRIKLIFINDGDEPLDNCELSIEPIEEGVRFEEVNYKTSFGAALYRTINDPFSLSERCAQELLNDVNPNAEKGIDAFYLYAPPSIPSVTLSWKMTSKHYSQEGLLTININFQYREFSAEGEEKKIIIEDYVVTK